MTAPTTPARRRTPQDYAIEHAGYLANAAERLIDAVCVDAQANVDHDEQDTQETAKAVDTAREDAGEYMTALRNRIYEFRKRRDRAALAAPADHSADVGKLVSQWVSVDERLPARYEDVLVNPRPTDYCCEAQVGVDGQWEYAEYGAWGVERIKCTVTHWQLMPAAPLAGPVEQGEQG